MRRSEKEIIDPEIIKSVFENADICRIGLIDGDMAYIVPMNFGYENKHLYFHSAGEGKKINILKSNPMVSFEIDVDHKIIESGPACSWSASYISLMGHGEVEFIYDQKEKKRGLNLIMKKYSGKDDWTFPDDTIAGTLVFRISFEYITCKGSG